MRCASALRLRAASGQAWRGCARRSRAVWGDTRLIPRARLVAERRRRGGVRMAVDGARRWRRERPSASEVPGPRAGSARGGCSSPPPARAACAPSRQSPSARPPPLATPDVADDQRPRAPRSSRAARPFPAACTHPHLAGISASRLRSLLTACNRPVRPAVCKRAACPQLAGPCSRGSQSLDLTISDCAPRSPS